MANIKSAKKRARQNIIRNERNKTRTSLIRGVIKKFMAAVESKDKDLSSKLFINAQSVLAKLATKGTYPKNKAARTTARLSKKLAQI